MGDSPLFGPEPDFHHWWMDPQPPVDSPGTGPETRETPSGCS